MDNRPVQLGLLVEVPVTVAPAIVPIAETESAKVSASPNTGDVVWYDPLDTAHVKRVSCSRLVTEANMILKSAESAHSLAYDSLDDVMWQQYNRWMGKYALAINSLCHITPEDIEEFRTTVLAETKKLEEWMDMVLSMDESRLAGSVSGELSATAARYLRLRDQLKILEGGIAPTQDTPSPPLVPS